MSPDILKEILDRLESTAPPSKSWLVKRAKKLSPEDFSSLVSVLSKDSFRPLLLTLAREAELPYESRQLAIRACRSLGCPLESQEEELFERAREVVHSLLQMEDPSGLKEVFQAWSSLPPAEARNILRHLVRQRGEAILSLLRELYRASPPEYGPLVLEAIADLATVEAKGFLQEIASQAQDRSLQKVAKRLLYRLRGVGSPTEKEAPVRAVLTGPDYRINKAWASFIDGQGNRILLLTKPQPMGRLLLINLTLNDMEGIMDCQVTINSKKGIQSLIDRGLREGQLIEIEVDYALDLIREYYEVHRRSGRSLPERFLALRGDLLRDQPEGRRTEGLIYKEIPRESLQDSPYLWRRAAELFEIPELHHWTLPSKELQPYLMKLREIREGIIIVSEYLQQERVEEVYREAIEEIFTPERLLLYRRRLEEMAYFLWRTERTDQARLALAVALSLEGLNERELREHPFIRQLLDRSLQSAS